MLHQKQSAVPHASSRRQPSSAYSEPFTLDPRIAAMRALFRTLQRTVDTMLNHEDSLYAMRDVESASGLKTELIEMRDSIDARMFTYHDIRFGSRARETKAVASELALPGYVEREAQFYDAAKAVLEEIDDALQSDDVCAPRDHIRAIRASLVEVRRRAIHLLKRVRNFEARSA